MLCAAPLCHAMPSAAMLGYALRSATPCYAMRRYDLERHPMPCSDMCRCAMPLFALQCFVMHCFTMQRHAML
eukprot:5299923-Pyramimonas_sp.AAC.1